MTSSAWRWRIPSTMLATMAATVPVMAEERWSSLAVSAEAFGWARHAPSKTVAEQWAMDACSTRSRKERCEATTFSGAECGAIAGWSFVVGGFRRFGHAAAIGATLKQAQSQAMADCRRRYRGCRLSTSFCNG